MKILVTGGAGYIGSHACVALLEAGHDILVIDNLSNSSAVALERVKAITGRDFPIIIGDISNSAVLEQAFSGNAINAVMHFAGLKAVGESCEKPLEYYRNNLGGTLALCQAMAAHQVDTLIFSSSATVYGDPHEVPIREDFPLRATNPYGRSKLMIEEVLQDLAASSSGFWRIALLRYFNPVGAHWSGQIGENPNGIPNNLLPYVAQVAVGKLKQVSVYGNDYPTPDGTGVRDYIHVMDLVDGHIRALEKLASAEKANAHSAGCHIWNLGTGQGYSVLEIIRAFEDASGVTIPYQISPRRSGDIAACWADPSKAQQELGWQATRTLSDMMLDTWRWQSHNPAGYDS